MKKLENNWRYKTLENLEKKVWPSEPAYGSHLVTRVIALRGIPLNEFSIEDMRIMIGQEFGLDYLVPLAIETLSVNLFAEGDFYEGDLLQNLLRVNTGFWKENSQYWATVNNLISTNISSLEEYRIDATLFIKSKP
nr:contact-dependent growth inhibition system immunity protein [uncultured Mucilaginibacter sp.]